MTREERNVLLFVAAGILAGSLPVLRHEEDVAPAGVASETESSRVEVVDLFPIDVNRAAPELLEQLPGIGPAKARAITELRDARGSIRAVEELLDVRGIGPKTVERLRALVTLGGPDSAASFVGASRETARERELVQSPRNTAHRARDPR